MATQTKQNSPMLGLIGSAIGGVAGLAGSAISSYQARKAQQETNELNYKIWGEQQQHNIDMFNMQNQANIDMWNMQNEYNDPSRQIERLSAAGLNPYLAMDGNAAGNASSAPAAGQIQNPAAPQMQAPPVQAFELGLGQAVDRVMQGIALQSQIGLNKTQGDKNEAEAGFTRGTLPWVIKDYDSKIGNRSAQNDLLRSQTLGQDLQNKFDDITMKYRVEQEETMAATMKAQEALLGLNIQQQEVITAYIGIDKALQVEKTMMEIANGNMDLKMKLTLIDKAYQDMKESNARIGLMSKQGRYYGALAEGQETANKKAADEYDIFVSALDDLRRAAQNEARVKALSSGREAKMNEVYSNHYGTGSAYTHAIGEWLSDTFDSYTGISKIGKFFKGK